MGWGVQPQNVCEASTSGKSVPSVPCLKEQGKKESKQEKKNPSIWINPVTCYFRVLHCFPVVSWPN